MTDKTSFLNLGKCQSRHHFADSWENLSWEVRFWFWYVLYLHDSVTSSKQISTSFVEYAAEVIVDRLGEVAISKSNCASGKLRQR